MAFLRLLQGEADTCPSLLLDLLLANVSGTQLRLPGTDWGTMLHIQTTAEMPPSAKWIPRSGPIASADSLQISSVSRQTAFNAAWMTHFKDEVTEAQSAAG